MADHPTIQLGSQGAAVKLAQQRLDKRGYHLAQDGIYGGVTRQRVRSYQTDRSHDTVQPLGVDGIVGPKTWARLDPPLIKKGAKGDAVTLLQHLLNDHGFSVGAVDGDFGPKTEKALKDYQKSVHLAEDGQAGRDTWTALHS